VQIRDRDRRFRACYLRVKGKGAGICVYFLTGKRCECLEGGPARVDCELGTDRLKTGFTAHAQRVFACSDRQQDWHLLSSCEAKRIGQST